MKFLSLVIATLFLVSCSSIKVKEDYNANYDFSKLRSYAWKTSNAGATNSLIEDRVKENGNRVLAQKGYLLVEPSEADFLVDHAYKPQEEIIGKSGVTTGVGLGFGSGGSFGGLGFGVGPGSSNYVPEALLIQIYAKDGKTLLWRGLATETLMAKNPDETSANFEKVVRAILEKFPPKKNSHY